MREEGKNEPAEAEGGVSETETIPVQLASVGGFVEFCIGGEVEVRCWIDPEVANPSRILRGRDRETIAAMGVLADFVECCKELRGK